MIKQKIKTLIGCKRTSLFVQNWVELVLSENSVAHMQWFTCIKLLLNVGSRCVKKKRSTVSCFVDKKTQ